MMLFFMVVLAAGQFVAAYGPAPQVAWSFESRARCEEVMLDSIVASKSLPEGITIKCVTEPVFDAIVATGREQDL